MSKKKVLLGVVVFGSIWGLLECVLGGYVPGAVLTGVIALGLMAATRLIYEQRGMQLGMGLVAAALRAVNPLGGCVVCSVIAIAAEGAIFELVWFAFSSETKKRESMSIKVCIGIVTAYACYTLAYLISQIATPLFSSTASIQLGNLAVFIPNILSKGVFAGLLGGIVFPVVVSIRQIEISSVKNRWYYSLGSTAAVVCWIVVAMLYR